MHPSSEITLHEAAERLGVHYMTAYRYVRLGQLPARKESGTWRVSVSDLEAFRGPATSPPGRGEAPWSERLRARMVAGDVAGAWGVVEAALTAGTEPARIYTEVLAPALTAIGEGWAEGELGIEDEHLATAVASRLVGRLGPRFARRGRPRGTVVVAMPPGERHGLGSAMLADVLRGAGFAVLDLGPDTPVASLEATLRRLPEVSAVCVSVAYAHPDTLSAAAEMVAVARSASGPATPVLVGGGAVQSAEEASALGADGWAPDPLGAVDLIDRLPAPGRSA